MASIPILSFTRYSLDAICVPRTDAPDRQPRPYPQNSLGAGVVGTGGLGVSRACYALINVDQSGVSPLRKTASVTVNCIPITKARINLGQLAKREYFILEKD